jgi:hypothetical protein
VWLASDKSDRFIVIIEGASIGSISYTEDERPRVAHPTIAELAKVDYLRRVEVTLPIWILESKVHSSCVTNRHGPQRGRLSGLP